MDVTETNENCDVIGDSRSINRLFAGGADNGEIIANHVNEKLL